MTKYKITHDRNACIGCAACASVCPKYWSMSEDGKSKLKDAKKEGDLEVLELDVDFDCNKQAEESCPVNCIKIELERE